MRQFATYFPATQRQNLPDKTSRFGKTSFPSPLQSVAERLLISFAPLNCCYHIINKLSLCQPIYRTKVHFLKIVQTTHTFSRFIDYQLFTPYILNTITVISLLTAKNPTETSGFLAEKESIRLTARTGEFTRVSGACNGEFGGIAACNQCLFDCTESLFAEKERSVVALQQTSLLLRGIPANFSNLTRYAPLFFIFTIKYKHFLRIKKSNPTDS